MKWRPAKIGEKVYDLSHLQPFEFEFVIPEKDGNPSQSYCISVLFSMHCFTRGIAEGETFASAEAYSDGRETRLFDAGRYWLSIQLPDIVRNIGSRKCFHTGKGNFLTVEFLDEGGRRVEYSVFFRVSKSGNPASELTLRVESAYVDERIPRGRRRPPSPIKFSVIAYNTSVGKPIKSPPK